MSSTDALNAAAADSVLRSAGGSRTHSPEPSETVPSVLSPAELQELHAQIDSLAVLRLKAQAEDRIRTFVTSHPSPLLVLCAITSHALSLDNVNNTQEYAREACINILTAAVSEMQEPPGDIQAKAQIVAVLADMEKKEQRVATAAKNALQMLAHRWSQTTLAEIGVDQMKALQDSPQISVGRRTLNRVQQSGDEQELVALGFIPRNIYEQLEAFQGSIRPFEAVQDVENALQSVEVQALRKHFGKILGFFLKLVGDKNVKTKTVALGMMYEILSVKGVSLQVDLVPMAEELLPRLGDVNIHVRQGVFRCLRAILRESRLSRLQASFTKALTAPNWHEREEVLKLLIAAMLAVDEAHNVDFLELVQVVTPLMDDETPKVRYVAVETLCVLAHICGSQRVEQELQPMMDEVALGLLKGRFVRKVLPLVREETVDFPRSAPLSAPVSTKNAHHVPVPKTPGNGFAFGGLEASADRSNPPAHTESTPLLPTARMGRNRSLEPLTPRVREVRVIVGSSSTTDLSTEHRRGGRLRVTLNSLKPELTLPRNASLPSLNRNSSVTLLSRSVEGMAVPSASGALAYLAPEEIQAPADASQELARIMQGLQSIEWSELFETLNLIRKLLKFSPDLLKAGNFPEILRQVLIWAESLRSSLSKNALIVLGEMCESVPRSLEPSLDQLLSLLLRKSVDTNLFISEVAQRALQQMCASISDGRLVTCLLSNIGTIRSSLVKAKTAYCFELLIDRLRAQFPKIRDFAKVLKTLFDYSQDASGEVRSAAKRAFQRLAQETSQDEIDRYMGRILPAKSYTDYVEGQRTWGEAEETVKVVQSQSSARELRRKEGGVKRLVIRSSREVKQAEADQMQEVTAGMKGMMWKERYDAVTKAAELALSNPSNLPQAIESLSTGITDSSLKVSYHSVNCLKKLLLPLQDQLSSHLPTLVVPLSTALSNSNSSVKSLAIEVLAKLISSAEVSQSIPSLVSAYERASGKGKLAVLRLISELLPACSSKELIFRYVVPVLKGIMGEPGVAVEAKEMVQKLDGMVELREVLSEEEMEKIKPWREPSAAYS